MLSTKCFGDNFEMLMTSCLEILKMILGKFFQSLESLPVGARRRRTALSVSCPCFVFVRCLSTIRILSVFSVWYLSGFCLSRFCQQSGCCPQFCEKGCPLSICPTGPGRDRGIRTFGILQDHVYFD